MLLYAMVVRWGPSQFDSSPVPLSTGCSRLCGGLSLTRWGAVARNLPK